ncbi:MAG: hypothetical protein CENE_01196 [Candidatus Celerinatantimonas neptuna]|nr:MAG: hypothetical protein CENE_01196 [Candidatus Celerinatantimonas neptuna]
MQSHQLYYLSFAAALLAEWSPVEAQRLAYQLSQCISIAPSTKTDEVHGDDRVEVPVIRPVNPLNHVDWKSGGELNARWYRLCERYPVHSKERSLFVQYDRRHLLYERLNQQIIRMHAGQGCLTELAVVLFALKEPGASGKAFAWLLFHALRCAHFGMKFRWGAHYAEQTAFLQQQQPKSQPYRQLIASLAQSGDADLMCRFVLDLIQEVSVSRQLELLDLGIRYRSDMANGIDSEDSSSYLLEAWRHLRSALEGAS